MNLVLDIGNTRTKLAVFQNHEILEKRTADREDLEKELNLLIRKYPSVVHVISSNVSELQLSSEEKGTGFRTWMELNPDSVLPFKNKYKTPETLGNDRKALVAAASYQYPIQNVLIIDTGTCITYDIKNQHNEYLGGGISPGLLMRYKALHTFTGKLPMLTPRENSELYGPSTAESIHAGVIQGISKEVDGIIDAYRQRFENLLTILTGGDADFLSINLKNTIFANSNFLLEGLNHILEFNTSK